MNNTIPFSEFVDYLTEFDSDAIVGQRRRVNQCPLARFLKSKYHTNDVKVRNTYAIVKTPKETLILHLTPEVEEFIDDVDNREGRFVRAGEFFETEFKNEPIDTSNFSWFEKLLLRL